MELITVQENDLEALALQGLSRVECATALGIDRSTLYSNFNRNPQLQQAYKRGFEQFKAELRQAVMDKALVEKDNATLIFLSKRLNLFKNDFNKQELKDSKSAIEATNAIWKADISTEEKRALMGVIEQFTRVYEITELEQRIKDLENEVEK